MKKNIDLNFNLKDLTKRFYVFQLTTYYPAGGMNDIVLLCDTENEYKNFIENDDSDLYWYEILDTVNLEYFVFDPENLN